VEVAPRQKGSYRTIDSKKQSDRNSLQIFQFHPIEVERTRNYYNESGPGDYTLPALFGTQTFDA